MNEGSSTSENGGELFSLYQSHSGERSESVETDAPVKLSDAADSPGKSGYTQEAEFFESDLDQPVDLIDILKDASKCAKKNVLEFHSGGQHMWNLTYSTLYYRAQQISSVLLEFSNRIQWENVALVFPISSYNWFLSALYGCMLTGCTVVPVLVNSDDDPDSLSEIAFIFSSCKIRVAISTSKVLEEIVGVSGQSRIIKIKSTNWLIVDSIDLNPSPNHLAPQNFLNCNVIQFTKGYMDDLKGCVVPVGSLVRQAVNFSTGSKITRNSTILLTLEPRQGLGLFICAVLSVVIGASVIISDEESLNQPGYFLYVIRSQEVDYFFGYNRDLNIIRKRNQAIYPLTEHENDMSNLKAIFIDSPYPHPTFTFSFWKTMYKYGLKKMAMRHLLSLNELGGTLIAYSHPPDEGYDTKYENDESSLEGMLYTSLSLDLDAVKQGKVNILSVLSEQVDLGVVVDVLTGFRALIISDTGFIADDISLCIVDPDTKTVLPSGHIGEVWIRTSNCLTNLFYGLPSLTKQTFDNYLSPSQINTLSKDYNFSVDTYTNDSPTASQSLGEQDVESSVSVDLVKYTRTGVVGFFDTDKTTDVHSRTLLYITCTLKDIATYTCPVSQINEKYSIISNYENADKNQITESDTYEQALVLNNVASDFSIWSFPYIDAIHIRPIKIQDRCLMDILAVVTLDKSLINKLVKCMIKNIRQFLGPDVLLVSIFEKEVINYHPSNNNDIRPEKKAGDLSYLKSLFPGYDSGISTVAKLRKSDVGSNPEKKHDHEFINTNRIDVPSIRLKIRKNIIAPSYVHLNVRVADTLALSSRSNKNLHNVMITPVSLANFSTNDPPYAVSCFQINYMPEQAIEPHLVDHNKNYSTVMVNFDNITDLLVARCRAQGSGRALCLLNENMMIEKSKTYSNIGLNIGAIAHYMLNRTSLKRGARAIVSSSCAYGLLLAVHACLYADIIPIILSPPDKSHSLTSLHIWTRTIVKFKIEYIIVDNKSNDVVKDFLHKLVVDPSIEGLINAISDKIGSFEFPLRVVNINHLSKVGKSYYSKNLSFSRDRLSSSGSQNNEQTHKKDIPPIWGTLCDRILKSDNAETRSSSRISIMDEDLNIKDKDGSVHPTVLILVHPDSHSSNFFIYLSHKVLLKQCSRLAKCFIHQHINDDYRQSESLFSYFFNPHSVENIKPGSLKVRRKLGEKLDNKISVIGCHYRGLGFLYCTMIGIYTGMESILIPSVKYEDTLDLIYRYYSQNEVITTFILKRYLRAIAHRWTENSDTTKDRRLLNKNFVISCDTLNADASIEQFASDINRSVLHNYKIYLAWGSPINPIISIQDSNPKTHQHIKLKSNDIHKNILTVTGISNGSERKDELSDDMSPREVIYVDKGQPAEGSIIIVRDIVTKQILPFGFVGEIWIGSESNARVSIRSTHRKESDRPSKRGIVFDDELFCYHNQKFFIKRTHLHGFLWPLSRVDHAEKSVSVLGGTTAKNSDSISRPQAQGESASSRNRSKSLNVPRDMDSTPYTNIPESDGRRNTVTFGASELEMKNASLFVLSCTKDRILVNGVYYFQKLLELLIEEVYRGPMAGKCVVISIGPNSEPFVILMGMHLYNPDIQSTDDDVGHGLPRANSRSIRKTTNIFALNSATRVLKVLLSEHSIYPSMIAFVPVEAISSNLNSIDFRVSLKNAYMCGDLPIYHLICINDIPECRPGNRVSYSRSFGT